MKDAEIIVILTDVEKQILDDLKSQHPELEFEFSGSRVICHPPVMNTDVDVVILDEAHEYDWESFGFEMLGKSYQDGGSGFLAWRMGSVNLIVFDCKSAKEDYMLATRIAKKLNLRCKAARISLFTAIRDERTYSQGPPIERYSPFEGGYED